MYHHPPERKLLKINIIFPTLNLWLEVNMGNKCQLPLFDPYLRAYFSENGAKYSNPLLHLIRILRKTRDKAKL